MSAAPAPSALRVERAGGTDDAPRYRLAGALDREGVPEAHDQLSRVLRGKGKRHVSRLELDLSAVERIDTSGAALIEQLRTIGRERGVEIAVVAVSEVAREGLSMFTEALPPDPGEATRKTNVAERVGDAAYKRWQGLIGFASLTADTMVWSVAGARRTKRVRKGSMWWEADRIGVQALPIVALIAFLVGLVIALQSAYQLRQFGANIYVANLIGVSMTREMGPLMTAIIIAGRSGAAVAAEVATMAVNEEVDALKTMGLQPVRYVVVPKFQALTLTMPALSMFAIVLGIFGGFLVALFYLDISPSAFWNQLVSSLVVKDFVTGLVKSVAFAWIIVLVAAHAGFGAYGGAEAVGRVTTVSVVRSIFWVIVADAGFSILFYFGG